ncbi:MAG: hypothetical protein ABIE42_06680 [Candidatus Eisenbacteria bacterium]
MVAQTFLRRADSDVFAKLTRYAVAIERSLYRVVAELRNTQERRELPDSTSTDC